MILTKMRGGREEYGKVISPMFPRLHVNDAEKGGPRAPPRNKMALYEQLSVPSKRFKPASVQTFPMPSSVIVPSASSSQGCGQERSVSSSYYSLPQTPSQSSEVAHPHPFGGKHSSITGHQLVRRTIKHVGHGSDSGSGRLQSASANGSSYMKESEDDDDFRVPTFDQSVKDQHSIARLPFHSVNSQRNLVADNNTSTGTPETHESPPEHPIVTDLNLEEPENDQLEKNHNENPSIELNQKPTSHVRSEERPSRACNAQKISCNQETANIIPNDVQNSNQNGKRMQQGSDCNGNFGTLRCLTNIEAGQNKNSSCLKRSGYEALKKSSHASEKNWDVDKTNDPVNVGNAQRYCEVSEVSNVDSDSGLDISPDDVVGVIGTKHFWKARRAIVNQQRIFAVQVFELHRLIKVQKLLAASPDILVEGNPFLHASSKVCVKNKYSEKNGKSLPQSGKKKDDSQKMNNSMCSENTQKAFPLPTKECNLNKNHVDQVPQNGSHPGNPTPFPMTLDNRTNPWCFQPTNNQWLIPVMSPSEGLVYKPYMGPCPPSANFVAPIYGGYSPLAMPPIAGDFLNAAYGIPASYSQNFAVLPSNPSVAAPHCFPARYGHPVANATNIDLARHCNGTSLNEHTGQETFDLSNHRSEACSGSPKIQSCKESELHGRIGSSASSPNERLPPIGRDGLRFTPAASSDQTQSNQHRSDYRAQVIRVVPHNAGSATESAARIFQCIQEERQQLD